MVVLSKDDTLEQMEGYKWILILIIQMMELMNFHTFIFGIGRKNHQDRTVGGKKMHDDCIVAYSVNLEEKVVDIQTYNNTKKKISTYSYLGLDEKTAKTGQ